jgi:acetate kinase
MGIGIDTGKNDATIRGKFGDITAEGSTVRVLVIPTNEERMIARDTAEIIARETVSR